MTFFEDLSHQTQQLGLVVPTLEPEHLGHVVVKLVDRQARIEYVCRQHTRIKPAKDPPQCRRLTGTDLAGKYDQPFGALEPIVQTRKHLVIAWRKYNETRIGRQCERRIIKAEEFSIHTFLL